jgi:hypothetical protein
MAEVIKHALNSPLEGHVVVRVGIRAILVAEDCQNLPSSTPN